MSIANDLERAMLDLINQERQAVGAAPLKLEQRLNDSAEDHSSWMLAQDVFSHTGVNGSSSNQRMVDAGFDFSGSWRSGENIGMQSIRGEPGYFDDVEDIHDRLMNSSGHRANILNPAYETIGIGIEVGDYEGFTAVMITQNFAATDGTVLLDLGGGPTPPPPPPTPPTPPTPTPPTTGTSGNDRLFGSSDAETMDGLAGNDLLMAFGGADTLDGGNGDDRLRGGAGADRLEGGAGRDIADYMTARSAVRVDLDVSAVNEGDAAGDTYLSIERVVGSRYDDYLRGDAGGDHLSGWNGNDLLRGRAGDDTLVGGNGNDTLEGQEGTDRLFGNSGKDTFVFAPRMDRDVVADFQNDVDVLDFTAFGFDNAGQLAALAETRNGGADLFFDLGSDDTLIIKDTTLAQVMDDFLI